MAVLPYIFQLPATIFRLMVGLRPPLALIVGQLCNLSDDQCPAASGE
jgi:hypothetical protein